jgi:hypothetical protein
MTGVKKTGTVCHGSVFFTRFHTLSIELTFEFSGQ